MSGIDPTMAADFAAAGLAGRTCLELDWSKTPIGPPAGWPNSLRSMVSLAMASRFPLLIWWGEDLVMIYNDAYRAIIEQKHPFALGRPGREVFPEIWDLIGPMLNGVVERGEATWSNDQMLPLQRAGFPEECYFTFSYSPIRGDDGRIGGVFCAVSETTERVLAERRLRTLSGLGERTAGATAVAEACERSVAALTEGDGRIDAPFALVYLATEGGHFELAAQGGLLNAEALVSPSLPALTEPSPVTLPLAGVRLEPEPPWPRGMAPETAIMLPLGAGEPGARPAAVLVCGINPLRRLDEPYLSFFDLAGRVVLTAIASAKRQEDERHRLEQLAELDRAKTDFFSNVSHELRTPLTLLLGPVEDLLAQATLSEDTRETLEVVRRNALRLTRLVNTLLDFSRLEANRLEPHYETVDLAVVTRRLATTFAYAADRAGLDLIVSGEESGLLVEADVEMWEKIVLNLLTNAFKFTVTGSIRVELRRRGEEAELTVSDTGPGIPESELGRVFERFHRVRGTQARTFEGTGIGLALVHELVTLQHGSIGVASSPEGSTFTVLLPLAKRTTLAAATGPAVTDLAPRTASAPYLEEALRWLSQGAAAGVDRERQAGEHRGRVLVVEDNADMRDHLVKLLARHYEVFAVEDGRRGLDTARALMPDLVLTDVMMPGLDGFGLVKALRNGPATAGIPIIMLSARAGPESAIEGLAAGADDYLIKPFSAQELVARVRTNIELARAREAVTRAEVEWERLSLVEDVKRNFLLLASHELGTPISVLRGYLSMFADGTLGTLPAEAQAVLTQLEATVDHVGHVVDQMLGVARFEAAETKLRLEAVDLRDVATDSLRRVQIPQERSDDLRLSMPEAPVAVLADADKVAFIVNSLVDNAFRFSTRGTPVEIAVGIAEDGRAFLSVADRGCGIGPEDLPRLFSRFGRIVTADNADIPGIGLSLYLSREFAKLQGGDIEVESEVGSGSRFTLKLPLERASSRPQREGPPLPSASAEA